MQHNENTERTIIRMDFDLSGIGKEVDGAPFRIDAARAGAYAQAIGDPDAEHRAGRIATPMFAVVPIIDPMVRAMRQVTDAFALHGEHDIRIHAPIRAGMTVNVRASTVGIWPKPAGVVLVIRIDSRTDDGALLNRQHFVNLVPKATIPSGVGEPPPEHRMPQDLSSTPPVAEPRFSLEPSLGRRYAEASGDMSPYTFDADAAHAVGLPGVIVGGICTMSFASRSIVEGPCRGDAGRMNRLALRFSRLLMLHSGQSIAVPIWEGTAVQGRRVVHFEVRDKGGETVATHGLAEIAA